MIWDRQLPLPAAHRRAAPDRRLSSKRSPAARAGSRMIWAISGPVGGKSS